MTSFQVVCIYCCNICFGIAKKQWNNPSHPDDLLLNFYDVGSLTDQLSGVGQLNVTNLQCDIYNRSDNAWKNFDLIIIIEIFNSFYWTPTLTVPEVRYEFQFTVMKIRGFQKAGGSRNVMQNM